VPSFEATVAVGLVKIETVDLLTRRQSMPKQLLIEVPDEVYEDLVMVAANRSTTVEQVVVECCTFWDRLVRRKLSKQRAGITAARVATLNETLGCNTDGEHYV
jgi:predicted nucleic acid-binding protein